MTSLKPQYLAFALAIGVTTGTCVASNPSDRHLVLQTSDRNIETVGATEGSLDITISPTGTIQGYFRPVESSSLEDVHGSLVGDRISLFIGWSSAPIVGKFSDGKIDARVFEGDREHIFTARVADTERS